MRIITQNCKRSVSHQMSCENEYFHMKVIDQHKLMSSNNGLILKNNFYNKYPVDVNRIPL